MSDPTPATPQDHIDTLDNLTIATPSDQIESAIDWALPILRASLTTPAEREAMAARMGGHVMGLPPNERVALLREVAAMLRTSTPSGLPPDPENPHLGVLRHLMKEIEIRGTAPLPMPAATHALEWAIAHLSPSPPDPQSLHFAILRRLMGQCEMPGTLDLPNYEVKWALQWALSWAAVLPMASKLKNRCGEPNPRPDDKCPCCDRKIIEIRGEAPTAVEVWICSSCFDGGLRKAHHLPGCATPGCGSKASAHCPAHGTKIDAIPPSWEMSEADSYSWAAQALRPLERAGVEPHVQQQVADLVAGAIREAWAHRALRTVESCEGHPSAESKCGPACRLRLAKRPGRIARIIAQIAIWEETHDKESRRQDTNEKYRERAADRATLLSQVLSLFIPSRRSSDSSARNS